MPILWHLFSLFPRTIKIGPKHCVDAGGGIIRSREMGSASLVAIGSLLRRSWQEGWKPGGLERDVQVPSPGVVPVDGIQEW